MASLDDRIDDLYQLPPREFTPARTALAKTLTGSDAALVKRLKKPTSVPFAVNQLYWRERRTYEKLMDTGAALRKAQVAALEGRKSDVRTAAEAHRAAVAAAAAKAAALAKTEGLGAQPEPLARMLEAISLAKEEPEHPGRFTEVLQPSAFEALAGITPRHPEKPRGNSSEKGREVFSKTEKEAAKGEKKRLEAEVRVAQDAYDHAHDAALEARKRVTHAESDLRKAESALEAAQTALRDFETSQ